MSGSTEGNQATIIAAAVAGAAALLIFVAMMPGLFLLALFCGDSTQTPENFPAPFSGGSLMPLDSLAICRGNFSWPLVGYGRERITSRFGPRISPGGIGSANHKGIDIGAPNGTEIHAACGGTVTVSSYNSTRGYYVQIDHGNGISTLYQHMSVRKCGVGDFVAGGGVIGLVGSTGASTGNHLHFEVRVNGTCYDPLQIFS